MTSEPAAILVLGGRVLPAGRAAAPLARRIAKGAEAARRWPDARVIACGGRAWHGVVEADVIARGLLAEGIDAARVERERLSFTTRENLVEARRRLQARGCVGPVAIVTCDWHLPRALSIAARLELVALGVPALGPPPPLVRRLRERLFTGLDRVFFLALVVAATLLVACSSCRRGGGSKGDAAAFGSALASASVSTVSPAELASARVAADIRKAGDVPGALSSSPDAVARRAAARALAQIGGEQALARLGRALSDEDPEVVAWAAYGIALPCDVDAELGRDLRERFVHALAARAVTLEDVKLDEHAALDPWSAIAWGLGRCGDLEASRELARWLRLDPERARVAALALGTIAQHDRGLEDDVAQALVTAALGGEAGPPLDEALYPFGRGDWSARPPVPRLGEAARARLSAAEPVKVYAIRALGRDDAGQPEDLRPILADATASPTTLVEAVRALHRLGPAGDAEIAAFAARNAPVDDAAAKALVSSRFGAVRVALELLGERAPTKAITRSLRAFLPTGFPPLLPTVSPTIARRVASLRCLAAAGLHPGAPGEAELVRCAAHDAATPAKLHAELEAIRDDARLTALDRGDVSGERKDLAVRLARDGALRVKERALAILAKHAEAEEAVDTIRRALGEKELGLVAAAALAITERPSIVSSPGKTPKSAIDDALDPTVAVPTVATKPLEPDPKVLTALDGALSRPMEEADAEIEIDLAGAVGALQYAKGRAFVTRLCSDRGPALRRAGRLALDRLDPKGTAHPCDQPADFGSPSPLASAPPRAKTLRLETDGGALSLRLDDRFAPIAVARVVELSSQGFYDGLVFHRVVPGFVVQFGDPQADGYGGAHASLRCETAPVPFDALSIGVALAGRDTGSSQLFVTLTRTPHLDGSYSWLGRAEGDWSAIAEGDVLLHAKVE